MFLVSLLQKMVGAHLTKKWTAVIMTGLTSLLLVLTLTGVVPEDWADKVYGWASAVFMMNVVVTTQNKKPGNILGK